MRSLESATSTATTTLIPQQQHHSRSRTEPVLNQSDVSPHKTRSSVDALLRPIRRTSPKRAPQSVTQKEGTKDTIIPNAQSSPTRRANPRRNSIGPLSPPISFSTTPVDVREVKSALAPPAKTPNGKLVPPATSYFKPQSASSGAEPRSPPQKRAPASRSSHGIETSTGPPPAISTQRTYSQDKLWRPIPPIELAIPPQPPQKPAADPELSNCSPGGIDSILKDAVNTPTTGSHESSTVPSRESSFKSEGKSPAKMTTRYTEDMVNGDGDRTIRGADVIMANQDSVATGSDRSQPRNEDVFLNIARANSGRLKATEKAERRRSRIPEPDHTVEEYATSPHVQLAPSDVGRETRTLQEADSTAERPTMSFLHDNLNRRSSLQARSTVGSAHPLDDAGRMRYFEGPSRSSFGYSRSRIGRDSSPEQPKPYDRRMSGQDATRAYRYSNLSATRNNRMVSGHELGEQPILEGDTRRIDGTESTMSTTAPSEIWDELDDLKSRIRKLELTGKLPSSSAAAMSSAAAERPRTATTTVTTMSSSPKQGRKSSSSPTESTIAVPSSNVHPLLHSALGKVKQNLSKETYRVLQATAADALSLSSMVGTNNPQSSATSAVGGGTTPIERQLRRKADSMCRSLTELCLALSDEPSISIPKQRPVSRDTSLNHLSDSRNGTFGMDGASHFQKAISLEPEERPRTSSRVPSRLEARRTSMLLGSQNQIQSSPIASTDRYDSQSQIHSPSPNRPTANRTSSVLIRTRRAPESTVGTPDDTPEYIRPVSRAMTELTPTSHVSPRSSSRIHRASREYTSQHPMPESNHKSPTSLVQPSAVPVRRNYLSAIPNPNPTPLNVQPGNRRYASRLVSNSVIGSGDNGIVGGGSRLLVTATGAASQTSVNGRSPGRGSGNFRSDGAADEEELTVRKRGLSTSSVKSRKSKTLSQQEQPPSLLVQQPGAVGEDNGNTQGQNLSPENGSQTSY